MQMTDHEAKAQQIALAVFNALVSAGYDDEAAFVCRPFVKSKIEAYRDWETDRKSTRLNSSH